MEFDNEQAIDPVMEMLQNDGLLPADGEEQSEEEQQEKFQEEPDNDYDPEDSEEDVDFDDREEDEPEQDEEDPATENLIEIDGESFTLQQIKESMMRQADYTRKTQDLAQQRTSLAALEGVGQIMAQDPVKMQAIAAIIRGELPAQPQRDERPKFDDPIEELRYDLRQEIKAELMGDLAPQIQGVQQQGQQVRQEVELAQAKARYEADPQYKEVVGAMMQTVEQLPGNIAFNPDGSLDQQNSYGAKAQAYIDLNFNPQSFGEMFERTKKGLAARTAAGKTVPKEKASPKLAGADPSGKRVGKKTNRRQQRDLLKSGNSDALFDFLVEDGNFSFMPKR